MCGIAGIYNYKSNELVNEDTLIRMRDILTHRGPDGCGLYINKAIGLAHRRLSILDLSDKGIQPFSSEDGRYQITFNGEIFNFQELKENLLDRGCVFKSGTDTEVLLYLFILEGKSMLPKLNGMFAFAIWDNVEEELFICRDRLGIKPFYYSLYNDSFRFASEQKALIASGVPKTLNEDLFEELLLFKFIAGEHTLFTHIHKLLPGHHATINNKGVNIERWWDLSQKATEHRKLTIDNHFRWFNSTFTDAVKLRTISDVPIGVMLSGGLDSSSIAATLSLEGSQHLSTYTVAFDDEEYNEGNLAKLVADKFDLNYHELKVTGTSLLDELYNASWLHDEPLMHQNDAQILALSRFAKEEVTVLLSGEAADELMGGYVRYKALKYVPFKKLIKNASALVKLFTSSNRIKKLHKYYSIKDIDDMVMLNSCNLYPHELSKYGIQIDNLNKFKYRNQVLKEANKVFPNEPIRQAMYLDQHTFLCSLLDRNDRMTMGASIECRVPFLDYRLVENLAAFPTSDFLKGKKGKHLLVSTIGKKLPEEVQKFKKWGFGVPWGKYMREDESLSKTVREMGDSEIFTIGIFKQIPIKEITSKFFDGSNEDETILRQLLMIHIWYQAFYKQL